MKEKIKIAATILIASSILLGCTNFGKEKNFNGVQLFYTSSITENEAIILGNFLISSGFADGEHKTVQLNKEGNTYQFRMVVKKGVEQDQEFANLGKELARELSRYVFNGQNVDVHYCDTRLKTLRVMPMLLE